MSGGETRGATVEEKCLQLRFLLVHISLQAEPSPLSGWNNAFR